MLDWSNFFLSYIVKCVGVVWWCFSILFASLLQYLLLLVVSTSCCVSTAWNSLFLLVYKEQVSLGVPSITTQIGKKFDFYVCLFVFLLCCTIALSVVSWSLILLSVDFIWCFNMKFVIEWRVKNIQKITKAMKMAAASKLWAIQWSAKNSCCLWQPFTDVLGDASSMSFI